MHISSRVVRNTKVVSAFGSLIGMHVAEFSRRLRRIQECKAGSIVVDLGGVSFIDSCGLGALIYVHQLCEELGKALTIAAPRDLIRGIFGTSGLDKYLPIVEWERWRTSQSVQRNTARAQAAHHAVA
jgi:anti-anti-sigma factor